MNSNKEYYYQIDYIDKDGLATYIDTEHERDRAIRKVNYLNYANASINRDTKFVLDKYSFYFTEEGEAVGDAIEEKNITDSTTTIEYIERVKNGYYKKENTVFVCTGSPQLNHKLTKGVVLNEK